MSGAVLVGGSSTRMGTNKLELRVDGVTLAQRAAQSLRGAGVDELLVVGGHTLLRASLGGRAVDDLRPGEGPLQAVLAALNAASHDVVLVVAGDMPDVDPAQLRRLVLIAQQDGVDAVVPIRTVEGIPRREVLCACYHRRVADAFRSAIEAGERSIRGALDRVEVREVAVQDGPGWLDLDTPHDARRRGVEVPFGGGQGAGPSPASLAVVSGPEAVDVQQLHALLSSPITLIDVREPDEFVAARVPGAQLVPLATVPDVVGELPTDRPVYVICHSGGRSQRAADWLATQGIVAVNVAGGTAAWLEAGFEAHSGPVAHP